MSDFWKDYEPEPTRPAPMTTERALDLALEALEYRALGITSGGKDLDDRAITAIKQARVLDKKAENARELGLDYEPPCKTGSQCTSKCEQCVVQQPKEEHMNNNFTLGIQGTVEPNITFLTNSSKEAMRIDKNGVKVNPDFPMDEAAQYVIKALDEHIKSLIHAEREAISDEWWMCVQSDLEHGVKSLNEQAAKEWRNNYPEIAKFGAWLAARENT